MGIRPRRRNQPKRRVTVEDVEMAHEIIERCLQLYMSQKEAVEAILKRTKIEPSIIEIVWEKLEEGNPEFFSAYNLQLKGKNQKTEFNEQPEHPAGVASIQNMNQQQFCYEPDAVQSLKFESTEFGVAPNISSAYFNGGSALNTKIPMIGINGGMIQSKTAYSNCGPNMYALEAHSRVGDALNASFGHESTYQSLNNPHLDTFGFSGQIPRNFSFSDLPADFLQSSDQLKNYDYDRSSLLRPDAEDFSDICLDKGDSSGGEANRDSQERFQRKRTREQPRSDDAVSTDFQGSIEITNSKKHKNQKFCVPCPPPSFSLQKPAETSARKQKAQQDVHDKKLEDVVHDSNKSRPVVPIGPGFQAEIPVWIAPTKKGAFYGSPADSNTLKWLGIGVWPTYSLKDEAHYKELDRVKSNSCSCASPGSATCIKQHIKKARTLLERGLRNAFYTWKFDEMGEVVSKSWTAKEEERFEELVKKNPLSSCRGFWEFAYKHFPQKSKKDLISYYHNVFLMKRMRVLSKSSAVDHIDSDDDHYDDFLAR